MLTRFRVFEGERRKNIANLAIVWVVHRTIPKYELQLRTSNSNTPTMAAPQQLSSRSQAALQYLLRLKPLDGYAVERYLALSGSHQVRLKRR